MDKFNRLYHYDNFPVRFYYCFIPQKEQYGGMRVIFQKTLYLLQLLTRENDNVQFRIFNHLDTLLDVQVVPSDLALALKEVSICSPRCVQLKEVPIVPVFTKRKRKSVVEK